MTLSPILIGSVWLGGVLSVFSPCVFPLLPVYFGILTGELKETRGVSVSRKSIVRTLLFIGGVSTVFVLLGVGASYLGAWLPMTYLPVILGGVVIILGLKQLGVLRLPFTEKQQRLTVKKSRLASYFGAYLLGLSFSFSWTPCIGPTLSAILALSLTGKEVLYGGGLMGVYSVGMAMPFIVMTVLSQLVLAKSKALMPYLGHLQKLGGLLIIGMGFAIMFGQVNVLTGLFSKGGW